MTTPSTHRSTVLSFLGALQAKPRGVAAVVALGVWLAVTGAFALLEPDCDVEGAKPSITSADFWRNGWWRYSSSRGVTLTALQFTDSDHGWVAGHQGTILATKDGGNSWILQHSGVSENLYSIHFVDPIHGWAVGASGVILATLNGGKTWVRQKSSTTKWLSSVFFTDSATGWAVVDAVNSATEPQALLLSTDDGGLHWSERKIPNVLHLNSIYFTDANHGWAVGSEGAILVTDDGGATWSRQSSSTEQELTSVVFRGTNDGWAVGVNGTILTTHDGGKRWNRQESETIKTLRSAHFVDEAHGWLIENGDELRSTENGGRSWSKTGKFDPRMNWVPAIWFRDRLKGWASAEWGRIFETSDGGKHWSVVQFVGNDRLPNGYWLFSIGCGVIFLVGLVGVRAPTGTDAISALLSSDRPRRGSESDALGAKPLAWALSRFLRHRNTEPPLTIALNAPWGGGKSSLMNWLREDLERFGFRPAWFNAWHYEKQEQMFPALLETIRQQAVPPWLSWSGLWFRLRLLWHRAKERPAMTTLLLILACFPAGYLAANPDDIWRNTKDQIAASLEQAFPRRAGAARSPTTTSVSPQKPEKAAAKASVEGSNPLAWMIGLFPGLAPLFGLWKGLQSFGSTGDWLARWFNPTEQSKATRETAYRAQFARDFRAVSSALDNTLVIFVDDLDRCQPKSVCEVMETLNFLASEGSCHMILGIWREGVERAIGLGFADAAKEFAHIGELQSGSAALDEAEQRRRYGQLYLEKLVNIWVAVPSFDEAATRGMASPLDGFTSESGMEAASTTERIRDRVRQLPGIALKWLHQGWLGWRARGRRIFSRGAWQGWHWAAQFSRVFRQLLKITGITVLGWAIAVFMGESGADRYLLGLFQVADHLYHKLPDDWISSAFLGLCFFLLGLLPQWLLRFARFVALRHLPDTPLLRLRWIAIGVLAALLLVTGWSVFQTGSQWSDPPSVGQLNSAQPATAAFTPDKSPTVADAMTANPAPTPNPAQTGKAHVILLGIDREGVNWQVGATLIVGLLLWIEWLRFRLESPSDSPAFEEALQFWSPVLAKRFDTPRRYKRFLNHLRFNAMRLRTLDRPDRTSWEQAWNRYIRGEEPETAREDEMQGKESGLLLLSVLEACCGDDFITKSMLVTKTGGSAKSFHRGWDGRLAIDAQLTSEQGTAWSADLRKLLVERLRLFEANAMPQPSLTDLKQFEALTPARITPKSVRTAGLSEQAASWDAKTERRHHQERRGTTVDTGRFVADRRTGRDRRAQPEAPASAAG